MHNDRVVYATLPGETEKWQSRLKEVTDEVIRLQAEIGASSSFIGNSGTGANSQLAVRVGLRHLF